MSPKPGPPEGYEDVTIHEITAAKLRKTTGATWRKPIHGTHVMVDDAGNVLAHIRTLGIFLPVKDRRYSLRVHGVLFKRNIPLLDNRALTLSEIAPYDTAAAAREAGSALIARMRKEAPMTLILNLPPKAQGSLDRVIDSLDYLVRTEGEPAIGGEQYYNRLFLDAVADEITGIFAHLPSAQEATKIDQALYLAQGMFREICKYREISLSLLATLRDTLTPYKSPPTVRVVERPRVMEVARPDDAVRSNAAAILSQDLSRPMADVEKALADLAEAGYLIVRKN